jgi:ribosomal protein L13E
MQALTPGRPHPSCASGLARHLIADPYDSISLLPAEAQKFRKVPGVALGNGFTVAEASKSGLKRVERER